MPAVTVTATEMNSGGDHLVTLSLKYWSPTTAGKWSAFDPNLLKDLYNNELKASGFNVKRTMILELSQYLENYLWPNYKPTESGDQSVEHLMSIVVMINEKFRERVSTWQCFEASPDHFGDFVSQVTRLMVLRAKDLSFKERTALLVFIIHCFNGIEVQLIRDQIQKYISLGIWSNLSAKRRELEFKKLPKLQKYWNAIQKKDKQMNDQTRDRVTFERNFLYELTKQFYSYLSLIPSAEQKPTLDKRSHEVVRYCERFLELMIDLESIMQTRRFFNALMDDMHLVIICRMSNLFKRPTHDSKLFGQLLEMLRFYSNFEIDDISGEALTEQEMTAKHYEAIQRLQAQVFKHFPDYKDIYIANTSAIDTRNALYKHLRPLKDSDLTKLASLTGLGDEEELSKTCNRDLILELIVSKHERQSPQLHALNEMPLYPSEAIIWDENLVSSQFYSGDGCLALPKLNLQFLTLHDYLLRNFHLFRLESTYEIRQDIEAAVSHMKPWRTESGGVMFGGWARMAIAIDSFTVVEVRKPNLGEKHPSRVRADIVVNLNVRREVKNEWESLRKHDVCFVVTVRPNCPPGTPYRYKEPFIPQVGLTYVRGCEIEGMLDPQGKIIDETSLDKPYYDTDFRTYRVWLDCNQYKLDMDRTSGDDEDIYDSFNILVRRKPKENNFKAVLETIRDLMNTECVVPEWLQEVVLGFGDPSAAHYSNLPSKLSTIDFCDTFLDFEHLKDSFPGYEIKHSCKDTKQIVPPFKLTFEEPDDEEEESEKKESKSIVVKPYIIPSRGPYPMEMPKKNSVRFTPTQVEAIKSGVEPGLTVVVGPPGTGKTDVAVQIISNIYHNFPEQRTLIVTHSNQALNALFEKIMALDIDERHLLRLGHGEEALETEKDFSRYGRVNYVLAKRIDLLNRVEVLAKSLDVKSDVGYTCETASYFFLYHVLSRWEQYINKLSSDKNVANVSKLFPFAKFFESAPQPLFKEQSFEEDLEIARGCYRYIKKMFTQLDEFKAFEMLRSGLDRSNYLLVREAKIIAMTCTHAALKRKELVNIGFQYDNILMEESAQILEIETFIPLLLQNPEHGHNRLKRWIMIGDHHQLPPVIKNITFQKFSNMEQSLFTRFVRLGVPTIDLDAQGRARPSLSDLYNWRYKQLGNLAHVSTLPEYQYSNSGFRWDYQLINVDDFNGVGESEPVPFFYQNLAEAEYCVATFMYMRLLGYPAEKITILTTYNGQKHLLRDVVKQRCASNPFIGVPSKITTVDKFQGQQNDYIILSLVRTKTVGHIRDVRRLIVALSRARLGLYIFCRVPLFQNCIELSNAFKTLTKRPLLLQIIPKEGYLLNRNNCDQPSEDSIVTMDGMSQMVQFVYQFYQQKIEEWKRDKPEIFQRVAEPSKETDKEEEETAEQVEDEEPIEEDTKAEEEEEEIGFEKLTEDDTGKEDIVEDVSLSEDKEPDQ